MISGPLIPNGCGVDSEWIGVPFEVLIRFSPAIGVTSFGNNGLLRRRTLQGDSSWFLAALLLTIARLTVGQQFRWPKVAALLFTHPWLVRSTTADSVVRAF